MQANRLTAENTQEVALLLPGLSTPDGYSRSALRFLAIAYPGAWLLFMTGLAAFGG